MWTNLKGSRIACRIRPGMKGNNESRNLVRNREIMAIPECEIMRVASIDDERLSGF